MFVKNLANAPTSKIKRLDSYDTGDTQLVFNCQVRTKRIRIGIDNGFTPRSDSGSCLQDGRNIEQVHHLSLRVRAHYQRLIIGG